MSALDRFHCMNDAFEYPILDVKTYFITKQSLNTRIQPVHYLFCPMLLSKCLLHLGILFWFNCNSFIRPSHLQSDLLKCALRRQCPHAHTNCSTMLTSMLQSDSHACKHASKHCLPECLWSIQTLHMSIFVWLRQHLHEEGFRYPFGPKFQFKLRF